MCLDVRSSSYGMKPVSPIVHDSQRGSRTNALTIGRLAFLEALGSKASGTYAEWHDRPTMRSAGHFKQGFPCSKKYHSGASDAPRLTLWKCTAFCIEAHMVKKSSSGYAVCGDTTKRKKSTDRNGWMPSTLSKGLQGKRENTSPNRPSALMRWFFASSKEKVNLAGNGAKSSPEVLTSGRGTTASASSTTLGLALLFLLLEDDFLVRLVAAADAESDSASSSSWRLLEARRLRLRLTTGGVFAA